MRWLISRHAGLERFDRAVAEWMGRRGHLLHRVSLGGLFVWFGALKVLGYSSATSIIAKTVYLGDPDIVVPLLGAWEALIGVCLIARPLVRVALLLLVIRLPGTLLALALHADVCFDVFPHAPSIQGQYLLKDAVLFFAALVIGGAVREERPRA